MRLLMCATLAMTSACAPSLTIVSWEPGAIAPHGARTIVLVDGEGATGARDVAKKLMKTASRGGWFRVEEYPSEVKLTLIDDKGEIAGAPIGAIPDNALWGRVDVIEWDTEDITVEDEDADGNVVQIPAQKSDVTLQVTVVDREGKVLLREQQYAREVIVEEGAVSLGDPLLEAATDAAQAFLADAAPKQVSQVVRLDDSDGGLAPAIENVTNRKWTLRQAEKKVRRYLRLHANNAIATYNLAVLVDAQGRHDEALAIYDEAMKLHTRDYYIESRAGCARRATAKRAVFGEASEAGKPSRGNLNDDAKPAAPVETIPPPST